MANQKKSIKERFNTLITTLLSENTTSGKAAAAVSLGVFIGIIPIYGFQSIAAIALAALFRLNKLLAFSGTFINNNLFQPFLIIISIQTGSFFLDGKFLPISLETIMNLDLGGFLKYWITGSFIFGIAMSALSAVIIYVALAVYYQRHDSGYGKIRQIEQSINKLYKTAPFYDRTFIKWKIRLDRLFSIIVDEDFGEDTVIDLGCGYGLGLAVVTATGGSSRKIIGCDINKHRIEVAREVFREDDSEFHCVDIAEFEIPPAGLIMIFDVLQYLTEKQQKVLIEKCCDSLLPGGKLIFRINDINKGLSAWITRVMDHLIFRSEKSGKKPNTLNLSFYRNILSDKNMIITERPFKNNLPLSHILITGVLTDRIH